MFEDDRHIVLYATKLCVIYCERLILYDNEEEIIFEHELDHRGIDWSTKFYTCLSTLVDPDHITNEGNNLRFTYMDKKESKEEDKEGVMNGSTHPHIEDLTEEKFSLQRALEASWSLAESLAAENSSLTDNYSQQRGVVNQLKSEVENLQEEMRAQLAELESFRMEYTNPRLECSAADERAGILASEVIGLEEKALKLSSNELKLEKQLENAQDEISSFKKKMSSLENDCQDLKLTIDALQEGGKFCSPSYGKLLQVEKLLKLRSPFARKIRGHQQMIWKKQFLFHLLTRKLMMLHQYWEVKSLISSCHLNLKHYLQIFVWIREQLKTSML